MNLSPRSGVLERTNRHPSAVSPGQIARAMLIGGLFALVFAWSATPHAPAPSSAHQISG
ncbi:MAG TPA: hypothetical protein VKV77_03765 [Methylovirgula sp.]|nr:hypothetical protein [Methylovirgula sp.]